MGLPRITGLAVGLLWALAVPPPAHAQTDPLAVFACERAHDEARHGDAAALCLPLAEAGSAEAQAIMGALHQNGQAVARDYAEAARWFELSARQGHVEAQFNLAALYNYGAGVTRDLVEAYAWYELAANAGNGDAAAGRALVAKRLSAALIDEAKDRAAEFDRAIIAAARAAQEPATAAASPASTGEAGEAASDLQTMVDALRAITDQARTDRSGDFSLLQRLRDLAGVYDRPWRVGLLDDNFGDGNFTQDPVWTVASGRFSIDAGYGLRNRVTPPTRIDFGSDGDAAVKLFGAILGSITKKKTGGQSSASRAEIHSRLAIGDVFSVEIEVGAFSKASADGGFEFGVYSGARRDGGYRLVYGSGATPSLALVRLASGRVSTIARTALEMDLEDGAYHRITLRRGRDDAMDALVDGAQVMSGIDRATPGGSFEGVTLINRGGDYAFRRVSVMASGQ
jgi:hypothetical protein